eukprot:CFRG5141T1
MSNTANGSFACGECSSNVSVIIQRCRRGAGGVIKEYNLIHRSSRSQVKLVPSNRQRQNGLKSKITPKSGSGNDIQYEIFPALSKGEGWVELSVRKAPGEHLCKRFAQKLTV